jgi:hypothetical protein
MSAVQPKDLVACAQQSGVHADAGEAMQRRET